MARVVKDYHINIFYSDGDVTMIKELDQVVSTVDLPEHGLARGHIGTVVLRHGEEE
jgi:hypothetical protein